MFVFAVVDVFVFAVVDVCCVFALAVVAAVVVF